MSVMGLKVWPYWTQVLLVCPGRAVQGRARGEGVSDVKGGRKGEEG